MKRKIVKQGAATLMVSLPSKWAKQFNLKKGDEIDVIESGKRLILGISTEKKEKTRVSVDISGYHPLINRVLLSLYIKGVDELEVNFSDYSEIKDFQKRTITELLGFEIMKQTQNSIVIKDITEMTDQNIVYIIARIFLILDSMIEELINGLEKKQKLEPIIEIDASVNKFVNFCLRVLNKKGYEDVNKTQQVYAIVSGLEEVGDILKEIARRVEKLKSKEKVTKEDIEILKNIRKFLDMYRKLFLSFNKVDAVAFSKEYKKIKEKIDENSVIERYLYELNETIIRMNNHLLVLAL